MHKPNQRLLRSYWSMFKMNKIGLLITVIMQGFGRRKTKERLVLFLPSLTIILSIISLTPVFVSQFPVHLCCAAVLYSCSLDIFKDPKDRPRRARPYTAEQSAISQVLQANARGKHLSSKSSRLTPEANNQGF